MRMFATHVWYGRRVFAALIFVQAVEPPRSSRVTHWAIFHRCEHLNGLWAVASINGSNAIEIPTRRTLQAVKEIEALHVVAA